MESISHGPKCLKIALTPLLCSLCTASVSKLRGGNFACRPCETSELIARGLTNSRRLQLEERKSSVILAKAKLEILALLGPMGPTLG